jgi:hypothetical protein
MDKLRFKLLIPAFLLVAAFAGVTALRLGASQRPNTSFAAPVVTPVAKSASQETTVVSSPDGKVTLTMEEKKGKDANIWTFSVGGTQIMSVTLPAEAVLSIPYNTFSPDNKYIFLKETASGMVSYPVLTTSGAPISKESQNLEISSSFSQKLPNYKITDVTGWAGPTLIVVNTDKSAGGQGPSFWFDITSHSFIQLSDRFN